MRVRVLLRRTAWVGIAACVVALGFGLTHQLLNWVPGVSEANVRRIHIGMTVRQVETLLGSPTHLGWIGRPPWNQVAPDGFPLDVVAWRQCLESGKPGCFAWRSGSLEISIRFGAGGEVTAVDYERSYGSEEPNLFGQFRPVFGKAAEEEPPAAP